MRRLFVLRPEPGASATVDKARAVGLDAHAVPLFTIVPIEWQPPDASGFDGLLLTSANAVRTAGEGLVTLRGLPAFAVGEATASAARDAGFGIAAAGDSGVQRLLASIEPELRLLHLGGADRTDYGEPRQQIRAVAVYRAEPVDRPDLSALPGAVGLVHSPRAGARLAQLVTTRRSTAVVAISAAAAEAAGQGWESVGVADQPTDAALLALAASLCNTPAR
ncbi:MAG: uroporphyrinogen-III synthase [Sphingomicrobium sp.]